MLEFIILSTDGTQRGVFLPLIVDKVTAAGLMATFFVGFLDGFTKDFFKTFWAGFFATLFTSFFSAFPNGFLEVFLEVFFRGFFNFFFRGFFKVFFDCFFELFFKDFFIGPPPLDHIFLIAPHSISLLKFSVKKYLPIEVEGFSYRV